MNPREWGPTVWYNFHIISYMYNEKHKEYYLKFFKSMPYLLPCIICSEHFVELLKDSPPKLTNKDIFIKWLIDTHNNVNKNVGNRLYTYDEAYNIYHKDNKLNVDYDKMIKFIEIIRKYYENSSSSIIKFHGENVLISYAMILPCKICHKSMLPLIKNYNNKKINLNELTNKMIDIINNYIDNIEGNEIIDGNTNIEKEKISSIDPEKELLNKFLNHESVYQLYTDNKLKVISKQIGSTPGIKRTFNVKYDTSYKIKCNIEVPEDMSTFIWIKNLKNGKIKKYELNQNEVIYNNDKTKRIVIGISLNEPKYGDMFYLNNFIINIL